MNQCTSVHANECVIKNARVQTEQTRSTEEKTLLRNIVFENSDIKL